MRAPGLPEAHVEGEMPPSLAPHGPTCQKTERLLLPLLLFFFAILSIFPPPSPIILSFTRNTATTQLSPPAHDAGKYAFLQSHASLATLFLKNFMRDAHHARRRQKIYRRVRLIDRRSTAPAPPGPWGRAAGLLSCCAPFHNATISITTYNKHDIT